MGSDARFLLDESGARLSADPATLSRKLGLSTEINLREFAVSKLGFVSISRLADATYIMLSPLRVAPLAAIETFHQLKRSNVKCVVLAYVDGSLKRSKLFPTKKPALEKIEQLAHAANKRAAVGLDTIATRCHRYGLNEAGPNAYLCNNLSNAGEQASHNP